MVADRRLWGVVGSRSCTRGTGHSCARRLALASLTIALHSCGSTGDSIEATFSPSSLEASFPAKGQSSYPPTATVVATLRDPPAGKLFARYSTDGPGIEQPAIQPEEQGSNHFSIIVGFDPVLAEGTYQGTLALELCLDRACSVVVSTAALPYTLNVTPPIELTAFVDGVPTDPLGLAVRDGAVLDLQSSLPVLWSMSQGGVIVRDTTTTTMSWTATLGYGLSTPSGTGFLSVNATTPTAMPQATTAVQITLTQ